MGLLEPICRTLDERFFPLPTLIQQRAIPPLLAGQDVLAIAPVGAGKTAAYLLPMLHRLAEPVSAALPKEPRAVVLTASRDRAESIGRALGAFGRFVPVRHVAAADSGSWNKQSKELRSGVEVVVTTPKQLVQLMREQAVHLRALEFIVLDDADEMHDRGMSADLERIELELPARRQTAIFVAVADDMLRTLTRGWLRDPVEVTAPALKKPKKKSADEPAEPPVDLPQWLDEQRPPVELPDWLGETDGEAKAKGAAKDADEPARPKGKSKGKAKAKAKAEPKPAKKAELPDWLDDEEPAGKAPRRSKGKAPAKKSAAKKPT